ncbi:MAG: response regulator [Planctomycetota bacterium]|nr:response regulator [Planctomycetota bacterium]
MTTRVVRVLLVADNSSDAGLIEHSLRSTKDQFKVDCVSHLAGAVSRLAKVEFDLVLLDLNLPDASELTACKALLERAPHLPVVVLSDSNDDDLAVRAIALGAQDYLCKDQIDRQQLLRSIRYAITRHARVRDIPSTLLSVRSVTSRPSWQLATKELIFGGVLIKQFSRASENQECVLAAFEEEGWPPRIDDPLPPRDEVDMKERLRATVRSLNHRHLQEVIRFYADGTGTGYRWSRIRFATSIMPVAG